MAKAPRKSDRLLSPSEARGVNRAAMVAHCAKTPERTPRTLHQTDFFRPTMVPMRHGWLLPHLLAPGSPCGS